LIKFIKKRVEGLIERDYLERAKDDARMYNYLVVQSGMIKNQVQETHQKENTK
jgi:hypothetical protein